MPPETKPKAVRNLRAPKSEAITKLGADYDLSEPFRAYLTALIEKCPFAGVSVDAHELSDNGTMHIHASITKLFAWLLIISALCFPLCATAQLSSSNLVTYAASGGPSTNTGRLVYLGSAYVATQPSFIISDGGTVTTNALTVRVKYGVGTNSAGFNTVATYSKTATNATDAVVSPGTVRLDIYAITEVITTNSVNVGTKAILQQ